MKVFASLIMIISLIFEFIFASLIMIISLISEFIFASLIMIILSAFVDTDSKFCDDTDDDIDASFFKLIFNGMPEFTYFV